MPGSFSHTSPRTSSDLQRLLRAGECQARCLLLGTRGQGHARGTHAFTGLRVYEEREDTENTTAQPCTRAGVHTPVHNLCTHAWLPSVHIVCTHAHTHAHLCTHLCTDPSNTYGCTHSVQAHLQAHLTETERPGALGGAGPRLTLEGTSEAAGQRVSWSAWLLMRRRRLQTLLPSVWGLGSQVTVSAGGLCSEASSLGS